MVTGGNMQAAFDALGVGGKPVARVLVALVPLLRPSEAYGVPCVAISLQRIADIAFSGDRGNASRAVRKAAETGALSVLSPSSGKGSPAVYALGLGCTEHTGNVQPISINGLYEPNTTDTTNMCCINHTGDVQPNDEIGCKNGQNGLYEPNTDATTTHSYSYKERGGRVEENAPSLLCPKCRKPLEIVGYFGEMANSRCINPHCELYGCDDGYTFMMRKVGNDGNR